MKMKLSLIIAVVVLFISTGAFSQEQKKPDSNFFIYLCFGQSNMEAGSKPETQDLRTLDPRFQKLAAVDNLRMDRKMGQWYTATLPINRPENYMSPVDSFSRNMVESLPKEYRVGVINVSVAGTGIELWDKDDREKYLDIREQWMRKIVNQYNGSPYKRLVGMAEIAQNDGVIKGILLHQGESNSTDKEWSNKVKAIYDNMMKDLNLKPEEVLLLAGELMSKEESGVCYAFNDNILPNLPKILPNAHIISSKGVKGTRDQFHFNTEGMREPGKRYAQQMLKIQGFESKDVTSPGILKTPETQPAAMGN